MDLVEFPLQVSLATPAAPSLSPALSSSGGRVSPPSRDNVIVANRRGSVPGAVTVGAHGRASVPLRAMASEAMRLASFLPAEWPPHEQAPRPESLARVGFYYFGPEDDTVRCYFCSVQINNWCPLDEAYAEHLRLSLACPLLGGHATANLPLDDDGFQRSLPELQLLSRRVRNVPRYIYRRESQTELDDRGIDVPDNTIGGGGVGDNDDANAADDDIRSTVSRFTVITRRPASDPPYAIEQARRASYGTGDLWPWLPDPGQKSCARDRLVDAGFYFTGQGDTVRCYSCDLALARWQTLGDPWVEHARRKAQCPIVIVRLGPEYALRMFRRARLLSAVSSSLAYPLPDLPAETKTSLSPAVSGWSDCPGCGRRPAELALLPCCHRVCRRCALTREHCPSCGTGENVRPICAISWMTFR